MKTKQSVGSVFVNPHILSGLIAVGVILATFAGFVAGRTGTSEAVEKRGVSSPHPQGNVTEAWVRRIDGPVHGDDHAHDIKIDSAGNVVVTGWIETLPGLPDCYTAKYSPSGDLVGRTPTPGLPAATTTAMH